MIISSLKLVAGYGRSGMSIYKMRGEKAILAQTHHIQVLPIRIEKAKIHSDTKVRPNRSQGKGQRQEQYEIKEKEQKELFLQMKKRIAVERSQTVGNVENQQVTPNNVADIGGSAKKPISVCQANNHPSYRLRVKREEAIAKAKMQITKEEISSKGQGNTKISRLELARKEARTKIQTFEPHLGIKTKQEEQQPPVVAKIVITEQPPQRRNDGVSSGAVAERRLREKRKEALEKILAAQKKT